MVIEDARDFYERAVVDFIKHDDADSAADLYFAVLNLNEHGHTVHVDDEQTLLRAHSILIDLTVVEGDKGKRTRWCSTRSSSVSWRSRACNGTS